MAVLRGEVLVGRLRGHAPRVHRARKTAASHLVGTAQRPSVAAPSSTSETHSKRNRATAVLIAVSKRACGAAGLAGPEDVAGAARRLRATACATVRQYNSARRRTGGVTSATEPLGLLNGTARRLGAAAPSGTREIHPKLNIAVRAPSAVVNAVPISTRTSSAADLARPEDVARAARRHGASRIAAT